MISFLEYLFLVAIAFFCELSDAALGGGYGTILTPVLLFIGYSPTQAVPAILFSELITGLTAALFHHNGGNVNFRNKKIKKITGILAISSLIGVIAASRITLTLPQKTIKTIIGLIITSMGVVLLAKRNKISRFSWKKIVGLGTLAAFNKGLSGGGYGPLITGGQLLSGVGKEAVGITSLSEAFTCLIGVILYFNRVDWQLVSAILVGAVLSVPFAVKVVRRLPLKVLNTLTATLCLILGSMTLIKTWC